MFKEENIFSDSDIIKLKIKRRYTFKDTSEKSHYYEIQSFLKEKAEKWNIDRIYFDLFWNKRFNSNGSNLFDTNPKNPLNYY